MTTPINYRATAYNADGEVLLEKELYAPDFSDAVDAFSMDLIESGRDDAVVFVNFERI